MCCRRSRILRKPHQQAPLLLGILRKLHPRCARPRKPGKIPQTLFSKICEPIPRFWFGVQTGSNEGKVKWSAAMAASPYQRPRRRARDVDATPSFCAGFGFVMFWACPVLPPCRLSLFFRRGAVYISTNQTGRIHWHRAAERRARKLVSLDAIHTTQVLKLCRRCRR